MARTAVGVLLAVALLAGLLGVAFGPAAGQSAGNGTTVDCTYPITVTDASGATVTVAEEPADVVVLAPSAAQVMWEIGAEEKVVGMPVRYYTEYLNGSTAKANVVNEQGQPQIEKVLDLEPDLVLAPNVVSQDAVDQLRSVGLTVYRYEQASSIADVIGKTRLTGRLVGACDTAQKVSNQTQSTFETYRNTASEGNKPTVYYAMGGGYTAGPETFIGDVIAAAGGENIATAANISEYDIINTEVIVREDPDWIVVPSGIEPPSGPELNETTAIREGQVLRVDRNFMNQPGPRVTRPLEKMATAFERTATQSTETTTTDGPGFGVVAAVLALAGAGLVARRQ